MRARLRKGRKKDVQEGVLRFANGKLEFVDLDLRVEEAKESQLPTTTTKGKRRE